MGKHKVAVLLSGGVDSSVALWRLKELGTLNLTAFYLKIWLEDELSYLGACPWEEDLAYAQEVCDKAGVPLRIINLQVEYFDRVVAFAVDELKAGRTPSPDIFCNERIKFGAFFDQVGHDFDLVATGHYAIIGPGSERRRPPLPWDRQPPLPGSDLLAPPQTNDPWHRSASLHRSPDPVKDQTYFLSHLRPDQLQKLTFPIGDLHKSQVRELARAFGLPNKDRKDSQGICFLGKIPYREFVKHYLGEAPGPLVDIATGEPVGEHRGFWFHTIGQRTGLGLAGGPWYVSAKDPRYNIVYVAHRETNPQTAATTLRITDMSWAMGVAPDPSHIEAMGAAFPWPAPEAEAVQVADDKSESQAPSYPVTSGNTPLARRAAREEAHPFPGLQVKLRHGPGLTPCRVVPVPGSDGLTLDLEMAQADPGIAPGQYAVLYWGDRCLGSGRITDTPEETLDQWLARFRAYQEAHPPRKGKKKHP